eukprot:10445997-Alexandrium_andersonii.AAC.1
MNKAAKDAYGPIGCRVLTITCALHRRWASLRLAHLKSWCDAWKLPEMCAVSDGAPPDLASWL